MSAQSRGWGAPPTSRTRIVKGSYGSTGADFAPGVHELIQPLVAELVRRIEDATGEAPVPGHCWGYAPRKVRGSSTTWSNHAWGLAIDYNAPAHPMGKTGTWGKHHQTVSRIARDLGFRFGGDYTGRKDDMHFEFMESPSDAKRRSEALGGATSPGTVSKEENVLTKGNKGNAVAGFQRALLAWRRSSGVTDKKNAKGTTWERAAYYGADGDFGTTTEEMVAAYQRAADVTATGNIDGVTAALLARYIVPEVSGGGSSPHNHAVLANPALDVTGTSTLGKELAKHLGISGILHTKDAG